MSTDPRVQPLFIATADPSLLPSLPNGAFGSPAMTLERELFTVLTSGTGQIANVEEADPTLIATLNGLRGLVTLSGNYLSDGANFVAQSAIGVTADNVAAFTASAGAAAAGVFPFAFDGANYDRVRTASAANQAAANPIGVLQVATVGTFGIQHTPAAATQATISRAAGGAGIRHIATAITIGIAAVAAQGPLIFNLRDGATGVGTILWSATLTKPAGDGAVVTISGLSIPGTPNTAMTLESAAAPAGTNFAFVSLSGYSVA